MEDVVVLAVSSSRSDLIQRRKWQRLREMHTCSTPTTPPPRSSEIWWSGRWDRQHDDAVSMVESMRRQGFAYLRGGRRTEKGGFRNWATAPHKKLGQPSRRPHWSFYRRTQVPWSACQGFKNLPTPARHASATASITI
jgi:hypothetical protein